MKKRGRMGVGMLSASVMIMGVYAATHLTQLTTEQTNFTSYAASTTSPKLTQSMWNGLVNKLDTLAKNHEERIRALENAPAPVVPVAPAPGPDLNCKPQRFRMESIKFTIFEITEDLKNGQSRRLHPVTASIPEIRASKYPNGTAPTWTIEVRCDRGVLKLVNSTHTCEDGQSGRTYNSFLGTCGSRTCEQKGIYPRGVGPVAGGDREGVIDVDNTLGLDRTPPKIDNTKFQCSSIEARQVGHGAFVYTKGSDFENPSRSGMCYESYLCDNGYLVSEGPVHDWNYR